MLFDKTVINKVDHLAKLDIGAEDGERFTSIASDLNRIGAMVSLIEKANTQNVSPMAHPFDMSQRLRPDVVTEGNQISIVMPLAPKHEENLFLVPKVIE
jgi:aspartyl-tRNA(Asn)/glutamyl-tRNA(Gln) amidotransferase subunit C